jgi:hypothetical protein
MEEYLLLCWGMAQSSKNIGDNQMAPFKEK